MSHVTVEGTVAAATAKAVLINIDLIDGNDSFAGAELWIPRACVDDEAEDVSKGDEVELEVEVSFLRREGYVE